MSMQHPALKRFLRRLLRHSKLDAGEQAAVLQLHTGEVRIQAHRDLVSPGRKVDDACLVASGWLGRFDLMRDGSRQITALHVPGDMCDLHSVVAPIPGWGITALSDAVALTIPHEELRAAAIRYPNLSLAFWRDTTLDASILAKAVANIGRKEAVARVAHLLCELGIRAEQAGEGERCRFLLDLTQEQLGDILGLTSVHVNRMIGNLRRADTIAVDRRVVSILDWNQLASIAEFDPEYLLCGLNEPPAA